MPLNKYHQFLTLRTCIRKMQVSARPAAVHVIPLGTLCRPVDLIRLCEREFARNHPHATFIPQHSPSTFTLNTTYDQHIHSTSGHITRFFYYIIRTHIIQHYTSATIISIPLTHTTRPCSYSSTLLILLDLAHTPRPCSYSSTLLILSESDIEASTRRTVSP